MPKTALEFIGKRIIGIIVEALIFPESVDLWRNGPRPRPKASKLAYPFIADAKWEELAR